MTITCARMIFAVTLLQIQTDATLVAQYSGTSTKSQPLPKSKKSSVTQTKKNSADSGAIVPKAGNTEIPLETLRPLVPKSIFEEARWASVYCYSRFPQACAAAAIRDPDLPGPTTMQRCVQKSGNNDPRMDAVEVANSAALEMAREEVKPGRAIVICTPLDN